MRIAVISTMLGQPWTGSEELWLDMVKAARQDGHEVEVSLWRWDETPRQVKELQALGVTVSFRARPGKVKAIYKLAGERLPLPWPRRLSAYRGLFARRPDVICLSQGWVYEFRDNPDLLRRLYETDIPLVVIHQANIEDTVSDKMLADTHRFFARATRLAFVAGGNLKAAERQLALDLPHGVVVRNPVNLADHSVVPWPQNDGIWNLAHVGRLECGHKSQDVLLEALSAPQWCERTWKLRFFGGGKDKAYIEALITHYGLGEHVEFGGHVPNVREIWAQHHLMVLPSRTEGTPLALVEAMLCGRAALVTTVAGFLEWVDDEQNGFIAEAPTARSIGAALERAWEQRDEWEAMGRAAHVAATQKYDSTPGKTMLQIVLEAARTTFKTQ